MTRDTNLPPPGARSCLRPRRANAADYVLRFAGKFKEVFSAREEAGGGKAD